MNNEDMSIDQLLADVSQLLGEEQEPQPEPEKAPEEKKAPKKKEQKKEKKSGKAKKPKQVKEIKKPGKARKFFTFLGKLFLFVLETALLRNPFIK